MKADSDIGYAYEVSVRIPDHLHDELSDLPPLPDKITIDPSMLSEFQQNCYPDSEKQTAERLSVNLFDKEKYVMHYRTLQMCYKLKLEVTQFHRVMQFDQSPWMRSYIDFNTMKRTEADRERPRNKFKINLHKAFNNFLFGRSIMNQRKFRNVRLVTTKRYAKKLISNPLFKRGVIINESLMLVEMSYGSLTLNRPCYTGFTVLELSKHHMYDFFYSYVKVKYPGDKSQLVYTDTDSFLLEIETKDVYVDMVGDHMKWFDFSEYPYNAEVFKRLNLSEEEILTMMDLNQKRLGMMKDEHKSLPINRVIALRSKSYALEVEGKVAENNIVNREYDEKYKNKSVSKKIMQRYCTLDDFERYLLAVGETNTKDRKLTIRQNLIKSRKCKLYNTNQQKVALAGFDLKRMICSDNIHTKALGYRGNNLF